MAQYRSGTANFTNGSNIITGIGTGWTSGEVSVGDYIKKKNESVLYVISSIDSNKQLTLSTNYAGSGESAVEYIIGHDYTPEFGLPEINVGDKDWPVFLTEALRKIDEYLGSGMFLTATGSSNAFVLTPTKPLEAYFNGYSVRFVANHTIDDAATVNVSGLGAKAIKKKGDAALVSGDIKDGQIVFLVYDATNGYFQMLSQIAN